VTGGDLGASTIALLIGMLALVALVPDPSAATWKKVAAAAFTGLALSSRMNYLLLMPPLIAALLRRASIADALRYLCVTAAAFAAVTLRANPSAQQVCDVRRGSQRVDPVPRDQPPG
jgi:hypothetical protein